MVINFSFNDSLHVTGQHALREVLVNERVFVNCFQKKSVLFPLLERAQDAILRFRLGQRLRVARKFVVKLDLDLLYEGSCRFVEFKPDLLNSF